MHDKGSKAKMGVYQLWSFFENGMIFDDRCECLARQLV
jgi:hypothetical protein